MSVPSTPALALHYGFEWLAYLTGSFVYWRGRDRTSVPSELWRQLAILSGASLGALAGSKALYWLTYGEALKGAPLGVWLGGKTIVGALLGGLAGVELAKRMVSWTASTGDNFVLPLLLGIAIGRIGCQLSGVQDLTYGSPTHLPWGWDYGDGVMRHPTAIYEIIGLGVLGVILRSPSFKRIPGDRFRGFMVGYLALRLGLDFLKPPHGAIALGQWQPTSYDGLSAIQWACIAGILYYTGSIVRWTATRSSAAHA